MAEGGAAGGGGAGMCSREAQPPLKQRPHWIYFHLLSYNDIDDQSAPELAALYGIPASSAAFNYSSLPAPRPCSPHGLDRAMQEEQTQRAAPEWSSHLALPTSQLLLWLSGRNRLAASLAGWHSVSFPAGETLPVGSLHSLSSCY